MTGPAWLADVLAGLMIAMAVYCVSRIVTARRWRRPTGYDVDGVHVLMGVAMAGMLVPRLGLAGGSSWAVVFGGAAAWFGWRTVRGYRRSQRPAHHLPHLLASVAMLYMALELPTATSAAAGPGMPMSAAPGFPALALALALALIGYAIWATDRLTSLAPVAATGTQVRTVTGPPMSPRLGACCDIVMGLTMGYMLIVML